jgi:DNA-directed RNA polymerase beta' subunit
MSISSVLSRCRLRPAEAQAIVARSRGKITRNPVAHDIYFRAGESTPRFERGGFYCPTLFGRRAEPSRASRGKRGKHGSGPPSRLLSVIDDFDPTAFAHIELSAPFPHPWLGFEMTVLSVLPAAYRKPQEDGEGLLIPDLSRIYADIHYSNDRARRLVELGAPKDVVEKDVAATHADIAVLFDNCFTKAPLHAGPEWRRMTSLASRLGTTDVNELEALLFALGLQLD